MGIFPMNQPGMFGRKPWATPGYGDGTQQGQVGGVPQYGALDTSSPVDPYEGQRPDAPPGMFGKGRGLRDAFGYGLGALAQQLGGSNPYEQRMQDESQIAQLREIARIKAESDNGEVITLPGGGVARVSRTGALEMIREPEPEDRRTSDERNFEYRKALPEADRGDFDRSRPGYGFTEEGIAALARQAQERAKAQAQYRAPPRAPGGGGGGITPTARAKYIAEAQSAIAAGADPAKVRARLTQMGIN